MLLLHVTAIKETQILTNFNCVSNNLNQMMKSKITDETRLNDSLDIDSFQWRIQNKMEHCRN